MFPVLCAANGVKAAACGWKLKCIVGRRPTYETASGVRQTCFGATSPNGNQRHRNKKMMKTIQIKSLPNC
jgi:hypothetical protein